MRPTVVVVALNFPDAESLLAELDVPRSGAVILSTSIGDDQVRDLSVDPNTVVRTARWQEGVYAERVEATLARAVARWEAGLR